MQKKHLLTKSWMLNALLLVFFTLCGTGQVMAVGSGTATDPYIIEDGGEYEMKAFNPFLCKFEAPSDGKLTLLTNSSFAVYEDAGDENSQFTVVDTSVEVDWNGAYGTDYGFYIECKAGRTYYLGNPFPISSGTVRVHFGSEAMDLELRSVPPEAGSVFNAAVGTVDLSFNQNVQIGQVTMTIGETTETFSAHAFGAYAGFEVKELLINLYKEGKVKAGDEIVFTINGVAPTADPTKLYNGTGVVEVKYIAGAMPLTLEASTNTPDGNPASSTFKSWYMSNDASGIVTLTFSGDINMEDKPVVNLTYGNLDNDAEGEYYNETITPTFLGSNIIMINLKNKLRRPADMVASGQAYETMSLIVSNVKDTEGNIAYGSGSGSLGSYGYLYKYEDVKYENLTDWVAVGGSKDDVIDANTKNIELWLSEDGYKATFDGAEFKYVEGGVEKTYALTQSELNITVDGTDKTILIPVPNITADAGSEITVSLTNVERPDGITKEIDETAFDFASQTFTTTGLQAADFTIEKAIWKKIVKVTEVKDDEGNVIDTEIETEDVNMIGADIDVLARGTTSTINTNKDDEIGYIEWNMTGSNGEYVRTGYSFGNTEAEDGKLFADGITIDWYNETLTKGVDYTFELNAWKSYADKTSGAQPNVGTTSFIIHGAKAAYEYSDVVLLTDITADFKLTSADDNTRTIEFSAPVDVKAVVNTGSGTSMDCTVEPNADKTAWAITVPVYVMSQFDQFNVNVFAKDMEGRAVNKTQNGGGVIHQGEDNTWFELNFTSSSNKPVFTVTPAEDDVLESLSKITFSYSGGININWSNTEKIQIINRETREMIGEFKGDDIILNEDPEDFWAPILSCDLILPEPITTPGVYAVIVPEDFFFLGEQFESSNSRGVTLLYEIKAPVAPMEIEISPAAGTVSEIPAQLVITAVGKDVAGFEGAPTLVDAAGTSYAVRYDFDWDIEDLNKFVVILEGGAITADGTYTLTLPAGTIIANDDPDDTNAQDIVFVYVIGTSGINSLVAGEGGRVNVYTINGVQIMRDADASAVSKLTKGMYIINGKKVIIR